MNRLRMRLLLGVAALTLSAPYSAPQSSPVPVVQNHTEAHNIAFSPDGKWLATLDYFGRDLVIWDTKTGRKVMSLPGGFLHLEVSTQGGGSLVSEQPVPAEAEKVAFSPDGKYLCTFRGNPDDSTIPAVWDLTTGRLLEWKNAKKGQLSAAPTLEATNWSLADVAAWCYGQSGTPPPHPGAKAVSADGSYSANPGGTEDAHVIEVWDTHLRALTGSIPLPSDLNPSGLAFSPDGDLLAVSIGHGAEVWKLKPLSKLTAIASEILVHTLKFSPDGRYLCVIGGYDLAVLRVPTWEPLIQSTINRETSRAGITDIAFSADSKKLAVAQGSTQIWDLPSVAVQQPFHESFIQKISAVAASPDGSALATAEYFTDGVYPRIGEINIWPLQANRGPYNFVKGQYFVTSLAFSHNSKWLGAANQSGITTGRYTHALVGSIGLWRFPEGAEIKLTLDGSLAAQDPDWSATNAAFAPDDKQFVADVFTIGKIPPRDCPRSEPCGDAESLPYNVRATFFSVDTGRAANSNPLNTVDSEEASNTRLFWLGPDGRRASILSQSKLAFVDTLNGKRLSSFAPPKLAPLQSPFDDCGLLLHASGFVAFRDDGKQVAVSNGVTVDILDAHTGSLAAEANIVDGTGFVGVDHALAAVFSPGGATLAVSTCTYQMRAGATLRLLQTNDLHERAKIPFDTVLTSLAFAADGKSLFAADLDGPLRLLDATSGEQLATLLRFKGGEWIVFTPAGLYDSSAGGGASLAWHFGGATVLASEIPEMRMAGLLLKLVAGERPKPPRTLAPALSEFLAGAGH